MTSPAKPGIPKSAIWASVSLALVTAGLWALADLWNAEVARTIGWYLAIFLGVLFGCLLLIWSIKKFFALISTFRARQEEKRATARKPDLPPHDQSELDALQEQLQSATRLIKESRPARGSSEEALYAFPWILLLGASGSGKSTLLSECGVDFHFSSARKRSAHNGNPGCDYWFSREAMVLDLSGRLALDEEKTDIFKGFLHQLKRARKARPLDAVVVMVSVDDILNQTRENVDRLANRLRQRFAQIIRSLGIRFPVYVLFTHCDKIEGFREFFGNLRSKDRAQVWGATISRSQRKRFPADQIFSHEFDRLAESLAAYRLQLLASEKDSLKLAQIYTFPSRFRSVREKLASFLGTLLQATPHAERPMFRGFYLTSAEASGAVDAPRPEAPRWDPARRFAPEAQPVAPAKNYFLENLFPRIIFTDRPLATASVDKRVERRRWMDIVFVSAVLVCAVLMAGLTVSFTQNRELIESTRAAALPVGHRDTDGGSRQSLSALENLRKAVDRLDQYENEGHSWLKLGWGLYAGNELYGPSRRLYFRELNQMFVRPTARELAGKLNALSRRPESAQGYSEFHDYLKAYLIMTSSPERADESFIDTLGGIWNGFGSGDVAIASSQLRFYTQQLARSPSELQVSSDQRTVELAQQALTSKSFSLVDRIYTRLKSEGSARIREPFTLAQATGGKTAYLVSKHDVPGIFTDIGWNTHFKEAVAVASKKVVEDDWVLGRYAAQGSGQAAGEKYQHELLRMYFDEYAEQWRRFLEGISMQQVSTLGEAAKALEALTQQDSGLSQLLKRVDAQTRLPLKSGDEGLLSKALAKVPKIGGSTAPAKAPDVIEQVAAPFAPLHELLTAQPEKPAPLAGYLEALAKLQRQLQALSDAKWEPVRTYVSQVSNNVSGDDFHDAYRAAQSLHERSSKSKWTSPVGPLLGQPIRQAWALLIRDAGAQLDARWKTQISQSFDSEVAGMYPFKPDGPDLPIAVLSKYFKPGGGILADFYEKEMRPLEAPSDGLGRQPAVFTTIEFSREFQDFMQRVKIIRETFFSGSPAEPVLAFRLTTPEGIKGVEQSTLHICDKNWSYLNGPAEDEDFIWPGKSGCSRARISIRTFSKEERDSSSFDGEWALFKLFKDAQIRTLRSATYTVTWSITGPGQRFDLPYKLQLKTTQNPFTREFFTGVRCPERVTS